MSDTIFAVSSGAPPAAIAILRVSGPQAAMVGEALAGGVPAARRATLRRLRDDAGETLDQALVLWFPGPASATGEDLLELHLHGSRAVIASVERAVTALPGTRRAEPGEFTRRALMMGRIDLAQAAGLADLLEAETETERRAALAMVHGVFSREVRGWLDRLSDMRARLEAAIDYDEEGDVATDPDLAADLGVLATELEQRVSAPTSERMREGWRVVIAGPRNVGKSSIFNAMLGREAAIVSPIAGTTRDRVEARVGRNGQAYTLIDTAGLAEWTDDLIEREGIRRSREVIATADLVLWVADQPPPPEALRRLWVQGRGDEPGRASKGPSDLVVSVRDRASVDRLWTAVIDVLSTANRATEAYALQASQHVKVVQAAAALGDARAASDPLIVADHLRVAAEHLAALLGCDQLDAMLDALFARFCVGK